MATISNTNILKRTSGAAENADPTDVKRRLNDSWKSTPEATTPNTAPAQPQKVYVVIISYTPQYEDPGEEIRGIYTTLEDANNSIRAAASDFNQAAGCKYGTYPDGREHWSSEDIGEGDQAKIDIQMHDLKGPGSEPAHDWPSGELPGSEEESEGDLEDEEEDESDDEI